MAGAMMDRRPGCWFTALSNMETQKEFKARRRFELRAEAKFLRRLDKALEALYEARMESRECVLTMNIKDLYYYLTNETTFGKK